MRFGTAAKGWLALGLGVPAVGLLSFAQTPSSLVREGRDWVRTTTGSAACPAGGRLQIGTRAAVVVRGHAGDNIQYTLRQRIRARSESEARQMVGSLVSTVRTRTGLTTLTVLPITHGLVISELDLSVPRSVPEIVVETQSGGVDVSDLDGAVDATTWAGRVHVDRVAGTVTVKTGGGEIRIGEVGGFLRCVSGGGSILVEAAHGETWCDTVGGDIVVRKVWGPLHASTGGGNIQVQHAEESVSARSAEGLIDVARAGGPVTAETHGGSIQIGSARGASCESGAGTVRVKSISGPLRVSTGMGSILAELIPGAPLEDSFLAAGSGDITVLIPSNLAVSVRARNDSTVTYGRIVSDFPEIHVRPAEADRSRPLVAEGALNGGGPVLRITAAGGTIYLRRQK